MLSVVAVREDDGKIGVECNGRSAKDQTIFRLCTVLHNHQVDLINVIF